MTTIIPPKCATTRYNIPSKSIVRVTLNNKEVIEGTVFINPASTGKPDALQLMLTTNLNTNYFTRDVQTFFHNEIHSVAVMNSNDPVVKQVETCMTTFVVGNVKQLDRLIESLDCVTEVSVSLIGEDGGRFARTSWLMLCIMDNLIPVDILELENFGDKFAWEKLRAPLFENPKILKIIHDCRMVADHLYHCCRITLTNVFDTQVVDLMIKRRNQALRDFEFKDKIPVPKPLHAISLTECLSQYIPDVVLERELALMEHYYTKDLARGGPLMTRPVPEKNGRKYAALTVKYLGQLKNTMARHLQSKQISCCNAYIQLAISGNMADARYLVLSPEIIHDKMRQLLGAPPPVVKLNGTDE